MTLSVRNNRMTFAGVRVLAEAPWPALAHLDATRNDLSSSEREQARKLFARGVLKV